MKRTWWRRQKSKFLFFVFFLGKMEKMLKKCYRYYNLPPTLVTYLSFVPLERKNIVTSSSLYIFFKLYIYWCETNKRIYATCAYEISSFLSSSPSPIFPHINKIFYPQFMNKLCWQMHFQFSWEYLGDGFWFWFFFYVLIRRTLLWFLIALLSGVSWNPFIDWIFGFSCITVVG